MSGSPKVGPNDKQRLLAITLAMELYTVVASSVGIATSNSIVFVANLVIAATGALASGFALYTVRRMARGANLKNSYGLGRLETASAITVGMMMVMAVVFIGFEAVKKLSTQAPQEGGGIGIALTSVSLLVSAWLWARSYRLARAERSPVFEAMWRMARMGTLEDLLIVLAVAVALLFNAYSWAHYVDVAASSILVLILLKSIKELLSGSIGELLDRSIDEQGQIVVIKQLVTHFDLYDQLHGFRTRRSGSQVFIELFLEFNPETRMREVYKAISHLEADIKQQIAGAQVTIVPTQADIA